jgi:hypothetical protein
MVEDDAQCWECDVHFCDVCGACLFCDEEDPCEDGESHWLVVEIR